MDGTSPLFSPEHHPALAAHLSANVEHDPATGCLLWQGYRTPDGYGRVRGTVAKEHGTEMPERLAWITAHSKAPPKGTSLKHSCGNRRCINPDHLTPAEGHDLQYPVGSIGALLIGRHRIDASIAWAMQNYRPGGWKGFRPCVVFGIPDRIVEIVRTIAPRATRTVLPSGFIRFDLPPGVTVLEDDDTDPAPADDFLLPLAA